MTHPDEILTYLQQHGIRKVKLAGCDVDGVLRGKYISLEKLQSAARYGFGFCDVIFGWDVADGCYDFPTITGWHTGYPDTLTRVDLRTLRTIPWEPGTAFFLCDFWKESDTPLEICPRNLLKRVVAQTEGMGFRPRASLEYEFWIFRETPESVAGKGFQQLSPLSPGNFGYSVLRTAQNSELVHDLYDACAAMNTGLEGLHTETGPGVYEAAIAVQDMLEAADRAAIFKSTVKEVAARHGCMATFMAKWSDQQAGSSGHAHQSLWSADGEVNRFHDAEGERGMSAVMRHYVGGLLAAMGDLTAMFCPTVNSYKRTIPGWWAPTRACWGIENRTAALRAVLGPSPSAFRVENRLAGSDANPYLALAAGLASGLHGIRNGIEPVAPLQGSAYESEAEQLPRTLDEAAERLRNSETAREILGAGFVEHFAATREWEARQYRQAVTDWELKRYFEII